MSIPPNKVSILQINYENSYKIKNLLEANNCFKKFMETVKPFEISDRKY